MRIPRRPLTRVAAVILVVALSVVGILEIGDGGGCVHAFRGSAHRQSMRGEIKVSSIRIPFDASRYGTPRDRQRRWSLRLSNTDGNNGTTGGAAVGPKAEGRSRGRRSSSRRRSSDRGKEPPKQIVSSPTEIDDKNKSFEAAEPPIRSENNINNNGAVAVGPKAGGRRREVSPSSRRGSDRRREPRMPREIPSSSSSAPGPVAAGPRSSGPRSASRRSAGPRSTGPRSAGSRSTGPRSTGPRSSGPRSAGPRSAGPRTSRSVRPEPQPQQARQPPKQAREPFNKKIFAARQTSNPKAPRLDLKDALFSSSSSTTSLRCVTPCFERADTQDKQRPDDPFEYKSLDDLLSSALANQGIAIPAEGESDVFSLSKKFNSDQAFRNNLRLAIRLDVFETTPFYAKLPEKAKSVLLLPDSSLEGSWRIPKNAETSETEDGDHKSDGDDKNNPPVRRMKYTTRVLNRALEEHYESVADGDASDHHRFRFTGDDLFEAIGSICGDGASTHWIDIYGVQDREINHSWHLDAGRSPKNCRTVLWGFPPENNYEGTGVFSHIVSLEDPFGSTLDIVEMEEDRERPRMEPVLFEGTPGEDFVFRPEYHAGKELLIYRDIDVLHSAPDVAYRTSVMRFM